TQISAMPMKGFVPVKQAASRLGVSKDAVIEWVTTGCRYLPSRAKPRHEWLPYCDADKDRLFIARESIREIKAGMQTITPAKSVTAEFIDGPDGRYIAMRVAAE